MYQCSELVSVLFISFHITFFTAKPTHAVFPIKSYPSWHIYTEMVRLHIVDDCYAGVRQPVRGRHCWSSCGVSGLICLCMAARRSSLLTCWDISPSRHHRRPNDGYFAYVFCFFVSIILCCRDRSG